MRAGVYARVSTKHQAEKEVSLEDQVAKATQLARELGADEVVEFIDDGYSGADPSRPAMQRLLYEVNHGNIDLVVCFDVDRWARDLTDQLVFAEEIERHGARLEFVTTKRGSSPEDELFFQIKGAFSQYERAKIRQRSQIGKYGKAYRKGKMVTCSRPPYGFRYNMDANDPKFYIHEPEAEIVRLIFHLVVDEGLGSRRICEYLAERGIPSPEGKSRWQPGTITRMIRNEAYCGTFYNLKYRVVHNNLKKRQEIRPRDEWVSISVPPIVSRDLWKKAQQKLNENTMVSRKRATSQHLLIGRIFCGLCGSAYTGNTANGGRDFYYRCYRKAFLRQCTAPQIKAMDNSRGPGIDPIVWSIVAKWIKDPRLLEAEYMRQRQETENEKLRLQLMEDLHKKEGILKNYETQKDELLDLRLEQLLSAEELKKRMVVLERKKKQLEEEMKTLRARTAVLNAEASLDKSFEDYCSLISTNLDQLTLEEKKKILNWIGLKVIVYPDHLVLTLSVPMCLADERFETLLTVTHSF